MKRKYFLSKCNSVYHQNGLAPSFLDGVLSIETRKNEEERDEGPVLGRGKQVEGREERTERQSERELPLRRKYSTFSITFFFHLLLLRLLSSASLRPLSTLHAASFERELRIVHFAPGAS